MAPTIVPVPPDGPRHRTREASGLLIRTGRLAAHVDELRDGNAERVADPGQRGQVGVGAALFERDQHPLADPGARGELVQ